MLVKVDSRANSNKFYEVTLDGNIVKKRWGRVGAYGQTSQESTGEPGYRRVIKSKLSKGYQEVPVVTGDNGQPANKETLRRRAAKHLIVEGEKKREQVQEVIDRITEQNRHAITGMSGGMIDVSADGVIKTPVGIITPESIRKARAVLRKFSDAVSSQKHTEAEKHLQEYLSLVPQKVSRKAGWAEDFLNMEAVRSQNRFLDQLMQSYDWYETQQAAHEEEEGGTSPFQYQLGTMEDSEVFDDINRLFRSSINDRHATSRHKLRKVFELHNPEAEERYTEAASRVGNERRLWHGTQTGNILSILASGLQVPPSGAPHTTGRMFGDGLYLSEQSTKSLNYSYGVWGGNRSETCYMLLTDAALGRTYNPSHYGGIGRDRDRYDSVEVMAGTAGVRNHEVVVWNLDQVRVRYLCEFSTRN